MTPQINAYHVEIDWTAFGRRFAVWSHRFPEGESNAYSKHGAILNAYRDGRLRSCQMKDRVVYALVGSPVKGRSGPKRWRGEDAMPGMRLVESPERLPVELMLPLLLRSREALPAGQRSVRDFSGVQPLIETVPETVRLPGDAAANRQTVLHVACDWDVHQALRTTGDGPEALIAILPKARSLRTHPGQWSSGAARAASAPLIARGGNGGYLYRAVGTSGFEQVPGAPASAWKPGMLVAGASVQNSKESSIPWAAANPDAQAKTRSAALGRLLEGIAAGLGTVVELRPAYATHEDRRVADRAGRVGLKGLPRIMWSNVKTSVLRSRPIILVDARLAADGHPVDPFHASLGRAQRWLGGGDVALRSLKRELAGRGWMEAPTKARVREIAAAWHAADKPEVMWVCVVDDPDRTDFLPGRIDTKAVIYPAACGRVLQSLYQSAVLRARPPVGRPAQKKGQDARAQNETATPAKSAETAEPRTESHALRAIVVNLALKAEILSGALMFDRDWMDDAAGYVFLAENTKEARHVRVAAMWFEGRSIHYEAFDSRAELSRALARLGRTPLACEPGAVLGLRGTLLLRDSGMRLMPPDTGSKAGWGVTLGVSVYPDLGCYSASRIEGWKDAVEKGIVLRRVDGGTGQDVMRIARMCLDPSVRLNDVTVFPAPFKVMREIEEMRAAWNLGVT